MPNDATADPEHILAELQRKLDASETELAQRTAERDEALDQQTATAEVLQVINSSPGDLAPVFDAILEKAHSLCEAPCGSLQIFDGERLRAVATRGMPEAFTALLRRGFYPSAKRNEVVQGDFMELGRTPDNQVARAAAEIAGLRAMVSVPLQKDGAFLGRIVAARHDIRPFTDRQIALLQNFAVQAVIAMENARLLTETREALEQQTATAEVLQVINSSPGDLTPVFETMLEKAFCLCGAIYGTLQIYDGEHFRAVAVRGLPEAFADFLREGFLPNPKHPQSGILRGERFVQIPDMAQLDVPGSEAAVKLGGMRTALSVPLRKDGALLGQIVAARPEVRPFSEKEIALLQNFAAQAVIAMENARLLTETREALEQQTATAEVLGVINSSPGDLVPVFDAMLEKAVSLSEAVYGHLWRFDGEYFHPWRSHGDPQFARWFEHLGPVRPNPDGDGFLGRVVRGEHVLYIADVRDTEAYRTGYAPVTGLADAGGGRSVLTVALRKDQAVLGVLTVYRREIKQFSERQIALLQNFAAQAVIAMENARLLTETREALEQQTATAEVLQVINSSPGDLAPVFDAILEKAHTLCGVAHGSLQLYENGKFRAVTTRGLPEPFDALLRGPREPGAVGARLLAGDRFLQLVDQADAVVQSASPEALSTTDAQRAAGLRTVLYVALRKDTELLGFIGAGRNEARPFTDKEIALLQNFAVQAVIAMENARLLDEIRQRQAELRVTFDNMGDGVVMFDEDLRLAAWNRNFQELLDLPDAVLTSRPSYAEYLRILAERGEFGSDNIEGELSRRLAETDQELRLERTRPDARSLRCGAMRCRAAGLC